MNPAKTDDRKAEWKDQTWRLGRMLSVGMTDSHVHEGLLNGVIVGRIVMFWHQKSAPASVLPHAGR